MTSRTTLTTALLAALAAAAIASLGAAPAFAKNCALGVNGQRGFGPDYVIGLKTKKISCKKAKKVVKAYHACRYAPPKPGLKGRCTQKVKKFKCTEGKRTKQPASYYARVDCKRGAAKVTHVYQQSH